MVEVRRAAGDVREPRASLLELSDLGREWEWEETPEVTLAVVDSVDHAVSLCNAHSPKLVATLVADDDIEHDRFWATVDTPFVGNGFTRWVDGPYAFGTPELGLSNWESGRLLARSGVLAGDTVHTLRTRAWQDRPDVHR
jgi:glutamate-5-semialdehyde dehydrogenase